jgi:opacity protein-like surface antigen
MKRKVVLAFVLITGAVWMANAQDVITQIGGTEIRAKVLEVGTSDIKYKLFGSEDGPTYTEKKSNVFRVTDKNGKVLWVNPNPDPGQIPQPIPVTPSSQTQTQTQSSQTQSSQLPPPYTPRAESDYRKGYVGFGIGTAFPLDDEFEGRGLQFNVNVGYLFSKYVGASGSFLLTHYKIEDTDNGTFGLTGVMVGPLFSFGNSSRKVEYDIRPLVGYLKGNFGTGSISVDSDGFVSFGFGASVRWNFLERLSLSGNIDYYRSGDIDFELAGYQIQSDFSSLGITVGLNFRF